MITKINSKSYTLTFFFLFSIILTTGFVLAQIGIPNQFYGDITFNGAPAPDGLSVEAKINGETVKSSVTSGGQYGYDPLFFVTDPNSDRDGQLVTFFADGNEAGNSIFKNGGVTRLDLVATGTSSGDGNGGGSSGGGGGGSGGGGGGGGGGSGGGSSGTTFVPSGGEGGSQEFLSEDNGNGDSSGISEEILEDTEPQQSSGITGGVIGFVNSGSGITVLIFVIVILALFIGVMISRRRK